MSRRLPAGHGISIDEDALTFSAVRASGPGGQHVNTTSSAVQLRFDIAGSDLPQRVKHALLMSGDGRINAQGVILIRAENERSQIRNREQAIARLLELIERAARPRKARIATKPSKSAQRRRTDSKVHRGRIKAGRGRVRHDD
ncbi:MAG: alternative ribosome rescue aminoacyl-tRNA hydrolase ArfB [Gammaproteobacteria bacterium]